MRKQELASGTDTQRLGIKSDEVRAIYDRVKELGWIIRLTGRQHLYCLSPDGTEHITMSKTANGGGHRMRNYWARVRRWERTNGV
jgi:DNA-binding transcriptional regulator PaaX